MSLSPYLVNGMLLTVTTLPSSFHSYQAYLEWSWRIGLKICQNKKYLTGISKADVKTKRVPTGVKCMLEGFLFRIWVQYFCIYWIKHFVWCSYLFSKCSARFFGSVGEDRPCVQGCKSKKYLILLCFYCARNSSKSYVSFTHKKYVAGFPIHAWYCVYNKIPWIQGFFLMHIHLW